MLKYQLQFNISTLQYHRPRCKMNEKSHLRAGESKPAMASLLPSMTSAGLKAGGERGDVSCGKACSASEVLE